MAPSAPVQEPEIDPDAGAGELLEQGIVFFKNERLDSASRAFRHAVETGQLNKAGRALAYWHILLAEERLGHFDASSEALASFVVVAEEIVEMRQLTRFAVNEAGDFVDRFDLATKLERGRAMLSAAWARRTPHFGRSVNRPVPVNSENEMSLFLSIVAPCDINGRRESFRRQVDDDSGARVQQVTLRCGSRGSAADYYFDLKTTRTAGL